MRVLLLAAALTLGACGPRSGIDEGAAIRVGLASAPLSFDPRFATDATAARINRLLYRSLTDFGAGGRVRPQLADWQQLSPTHYRFRLVASRAPFHNGMPLTADDVVATYRSILDPDTGSPHRGALAHVERFEILDTDTFDVRLSRPDYLLPGHLSIGILPKALIEEGHAFQHWPVGSGPLKQLARGSDSRWRFERVADGLRIEFHLVAEPTVRALKLLRGEIDLTQNSLPPELVEYLRQQPGLTVAQAPGMTFAYLGFNLADSTTGQLALRQAIAHGIDRQAIVRHLFRDNAVPATSILHPTHWAGAAELDGFDYDPARASELLGSLGYGPDRPLTLVYKTTTDPFRRRLATVLQSQLAAIGIELRIQSNDWGTFYGDIKGGRFQMYSLAWVSVHNPDIFRYVFHSESKPPGGANRGRYVSAAMDQLIERADIAPDAADRLAALHGIQRRALADLVYVPLWYEGHTVIHDRRLRGYGLHDDGRYDDLAIAYWGDAP